MSLVSPLPAKTEHFRQPSRCALPVGPQAFSVSPQPLAQSKLFLQTRLLLLLHPSMPLGLCYRQSCTTEILQQHALFSEVFLTQADPYAVPVCRYLCFVAALGTCSTFELHHQLVDGLQKP